MGKSSKIVELLITRSVLVNLEDCPLSVGAPESASVFGRSVKRPVRADGGRDTGNQIVAIGGNVIGVSVIEQGQTASAGRQPVKQQGLIADSETVERAIGPPCQPGKIGRVKKTMSSPVRLNREDILTQRRFKSGRAVEQSIASKNQRSIRNRNKLIVRGRGVEKHQLLVIGLQLGGGIADKQPNGRGDR